MRFVEHPSEKLLPLAEWLELGDNEHSACCSGVLVPNDIDISSLESRLPRLCMIALQFPKWTDGRAYSQARLLRSRCRYTGEIRATGEVLVDMLPLLARTGFSAVQLRADQNLDTARRALGFFAAHYQGDVLQTQPWFARMSEAA